MPIYLVVPNCDEEVLELLKLRKSRLDKIIQKMEARPRQALVFSNGIFRPFEVIFENIKSTVLRDGSS
jgi:hypothetical protein